MRHAASARSDGSERPGGEGSVAVPAASVTPPRRLRIGGCALRDVTALAVRERRNKTSGQCPILPSRAGREPRPQPASWASTASRGSDRSLACVKSPRDGDIISEGEAILSLSDTDDQMNAEIDLELPARAENIAIVRHAFGALGEVYEISEQRLSDIRLAVTEACTNVVVHAYPNEEEGPLEVEAQLTGEQLLIFVRDRGKGIAPRPDSPGLGLGLPLIASLADDVKLGHNDDGQTEVRMGFSLRDRDGDLAGAPS